MSGSPPPRVMGEISLWDKCVAVGRALEEMQQRFDSGGQFGHDEASRVDGLVALIDDLRSEHLWSGAGDQSHVTSSHELASLYEAPVSAPVGATLEDLAERAGRLRDAAWRRIGVSIPAIATTSTEATPHELMTALVQTAGQEQLAPEAPLPGRRVVEIEPRATDPWRVVTEVLTAIGVLMLVFVVYAIFGTGLSAARSQRDLSREFEARLEAQVAIDAVGVDEPPSGVLGGDTTDAEDESEAEMAEPINWRVAVPEPGDPVAILSLPTIGARDIVVEGTTAEHLNAGPGHLRSSPLPGRAGNSVLFGRRTTFGGPFAKLDDLRPGDPIVVVTIDGMFRYIVQTVDRVGPGDPDPIGATFSNRLTLVTADERYSAGGRLIAMALLENSPAASPTSADGELIPLPPVGGADIGTQRTGTDWAWLLLWSQVLVVGYLGARWLYRHWRPWSTWLVTAPILLVVTFAWLDSVTRMLPSTL